MCLPEVFLNGLTQNWRSKLSVKEFEIDIPVDTQTEVFGQFDAYVKTIERAFRVTVVPRADKIKLIGNERGCESAKAVFEQLCSLANNNSEITQQSVDYAICMHLKGLDDVIHEIDTDIICHTINGRPVKPKTLGQKKYVDMIQNKMIVFGVGPAGTGKTYLAMAMAIKAFKENEVERIILTRPAIEAGEKLGFLPGDLQSKVDPYLRPLYDALNQIMGPESYLRNAEKGLIEVAPLAYMRGRTLDNAYIILDEAQNTTPAQMKMFLTRIGFGSKVIITGDLTQIDLMAGQASGLEHALKVISSIDDIGVARLTNIDVVRHPLVQKIVNAYDEYEKKQNIHKKVRNSDENRAVKRANVYKGKTGGKHSDN